METTRDIFWKFLWVKVAHIIEVIWLRCVSCTIHRFMRNVGIAGMTGSGYQNLCRPAHHRTAGGCCVCSREIEYGGIAEKRAHEKTLVFHTPLKSVFIQFRRTYSVWGYRITQGQALQPAACRHSQLIQHHDSWSTPLSSKYQKNTRSQQKTSFEEHLKISKTAKISKIVCFWMVLW